MEVSSSFLICKWKISTFLTFTMQSFLPLFYVSAVLLVFAWLLSAFINDRLTPKTDLRSWIVLLIASALWPIVLPKLSYILFRRIARPSDRCADRDMPIYGSKAQINGFEQRLQK
jgi:hypothetical protein